MTIDMASYAPALRLGGDGIWYAADRDAVSYPDKGNDLCFEIEDKSFWFRHRNACIVEAVRNFPPRDKGPIFDIGGGNGFVAKGLIDAGWEVVLVEPGPTGAHNAKARGLPHVVCATTQTAGFMHGSMPAIGVFDVVEHIEDDQGFLRHLRDFLESDGMLYLTVPAHPLAWSDEDVIAGHYRRYTRRTLTEALEKAGLRIVFLSGIFSWLLLPVFMLRALPFRIRGSKRQELTGEAMRSDHILPPAIAPLAEAVHRWELKKLSQRRSVPLGSSLLCAARKA